MKNINDYLKEFDERSKEENTWYNIDGSSYTVSGMTLSETRNFFSSSLTSLLEELEQSLPKGREVYHNKGSEEFESAYAYNSAIKKVKDILNNFK